MEYRTGVTVMNKNLHILLKIAIFDTKLDDDCFHITHFHTGWLEERNDYLKKKKEDNSVSPCFATSINSTTIVLFHHFCVGGNDASMPIYLVIL